MAIRIIVAGSRSYNNYEEAKAYIDLCICELRKKHTLIFLSGACKGTDLLGERYASENGFKTEQYPAEWNKYGRAAGPKRNKQMAELCDCLICFWDGQSKGTKSMIDYAEKLGKTVMIKMI